jgi:hypothetical protein
MANSQQKMPSKNTEKIPPEIAKELRALTHDLSNSLETILQATYLVSQDPPQKSVRWIKMIDEASQEAAKINRRLREVLREQS